MKGLCDLQKVVTHRLKTAEEAMLSDLNIKNGLGLCVSRNPVSWKGSKEVEQGFVPNSQLEFHRPHLPHLCSQELV